MTDEVMKYSIMASVSRHSIYITMTILHQVAGWSRESLLQLYNTYLQWIRQYLNKNKKVIAAMRKVQSDIDLQLYVDMDEDGPGYRLVRKMWRACVKIILAILQTEGDTNDDGLKTVVQLYDDWMHAFLEADKSGEPNEAVIVMNETLAFCGMAPVKLKDNQKDDSV